ncbi:hypothetical protein ACMFMG_003048 [Clarireedia jacksonii]
MLGTILRHRDTEIQRHSDSDTATQRHSDNRDTRLNPDQRKKRYFFYSQQLRDDNIGKPVTHKHMPQTKSSSQLMIIDLDCVLVAWHSHGETWTGLLYPVCVDQPESPSSLQGISPSFAMPQST